MKSWRNFIGVFALALGLAPHTAKGVGESWCQDYFARIQATDQSGARFLHARDQKLHTTRFAERAPRALRRHTGISLQKPTDKLTAWLDHLDELYLKAKDDPRAKERFKELFYKEFVIKPEEVPESYFAQQLRIARERGHGNVTLSPEQKKQLTESLIQDQKKSLDSWLDYFLSSDTSMYPIWAKYWAMTGLQKLSKFDPELGAFLTRSKGTVAPYPELNREALAYVMDAVVKRVKGGSLADIDDPELIKQLEGANFGKLYGHSLLKATKAQGNVNNTAGTWVVYKQGSNHLPLVKSLEGKGTGWCTAGEETARSQLNRGDFHVYYSFDAQGKPTIPRVAVRMEGDEIAEVRGVAKDQNLDPKIGSSDVVTKKMAEFGAKGDKYQKKDMHMRLLTRIEGKVQATEPFTKTHLF